MSDVDIHNLTDAQEQLVQKILDEHEPDWIDGEYLTFLEWYEVVNVTEGGCASGAYMPAVTYATIGKLIADGRIDDIIEYLDDSGLMECLDLNHIFKDNNLSGAMSVLVSAAIESWCSCMFDLVCDELNSEDWEDEEEETEGDLPLSSTGALSNEMMPSYNTNGAPFKDMMFIPVNGKGEPLNKSKVTIRPFDNKPACADTGMLIEDKESIVDFTKHKFSDFLR